MSKLKNEVTTKRVQDKYNPIKVWVIKRTNCGHYYLNQEINGKPFYKSFKRVKKSFIVSILGKGIV